MYNMTKKQIANLVHANTPIDTIISAKENYNALEVKGYVNNSLQTYKIYEDGQVIKE